MGYTMRFIQTGGHPFTLAELGEALKCEDPSYSLDDDGLLLFQDSPYARVEVNSPGDGLFDEELAELTAEAQQVTGRHKKQVLDVLGNAMSIVATQILWQDRSSEQTLVRIDPIWAMLQRGRSGLVQADGEGYYEGGALTLKVE